MKQQKKQGGITLFYSYAPADREYRDQLAIYLSQLKRDGLIEELYDQQILAGEEHSLERDRMLRSAQIILLLISADFLASDVCYRVEMQNALERHKRGEVRIVPVLVRPCDWQHSPFAHLQYLPRNRESISTWDDRDKAFVAITQELRRIIAQQRFSSPLLSDVERQNRARLLKRVRSTWIVGLLERSLHQVAWIDLHLQGQPESLANPWRLQVQELDREPHVLPPDMNLVHIYDEAEGELLILGEPGAGKTTLLLHLARALLDRAEADERFPIPVVFNLSSWAQLRQPLTAWLIAELRVKYQVPKPVARDWIETNQILPLLDGLDEVHVEARKACVQAITAYHARPSSQIGTPLVVCCRSQEYQDLSLRLPLSRAVSILPLTEEQIDAYLSSSQGQLEGLRQALDDDAELATLAHRPLMLSIFSLAYQGATAKDFPVASSSYEQTLQAVFSCYVKRMLTRRGSLPPGMQESFLYWLTLVAKQLHRHQQTVLLVEDIQADWLPPKQQRLYLWSMRLLFTLVVGLFCGLTSGLFYGLTSGLFYGLVSGLFYGLVSGLLGGLFVARKIGRESRIQPVEIITWSWKQVRERLFPRKKLSSVLLRLAGGLLLVWLFLTILMPLVLIIGLSRNQLTERIHLSPNEGTWRSAKNGLRVVLTIVLLFVLLSVLAIVPIIVQVFLPIGGLLFALFYVPAILLTILLSLIPFAPVIALVAGLDAFIQHFVLRNFLWRTKCLPWKLIPFLDEATERLFLRKVGGSYIFVHRLLLDYLVTLDEPVTTSPKSKM